MCDIIGCDEAAEYRDSDNLCFCGGCMVVNMQKTGKRNSGYERIEEEGVPGLNCPAWEAKKQEAT